MVERINKRKMQGDRKNREKLGQFAAQKCPFCEKKRNKHDCECEQHITYCFLIKDHVKCLSRINKTSQRGGTVRLLATDPEPNSLKVYDNLEKNLSVPMANNGSKNNFKLDLKMI